MIELEYAVVCMQIHERNTPRYMSIPGLIYDAGELRVGAGKHELCEFSKLGACGLNPAMFEEKPHKLGRAI